MRATIHVHLPFRILFMGFLLERTSCDVAFQGEDLKLISQPSNKFQYMALGHMHPFEGMGDF